MAKVTDNIENPPAFPTHGSMGEVVEQGMTLRDYFATKAMPVAQMQIAREISYGGYHKEAPIGIKRLVQDAYQIADLMLAERSKKEAGNE